ncbi:Arylsulfatase A-like enzyme OS=Castellaniella defragrans OX=75697 GN=HNR28_001610 PE=4 SV=1 [Castellaniella defragrans]
MGRDKRSSFLTGCAAVGSVMLLAACDDGGSNRVADAAPAKSGKPNILFVMMDDVGIDQMTSFGYGGVNPPKMPNMDVVAQAGIRFRNTWSQPECSPARASFFVGRYPTRTHIYQALGPSDLANAQLSPYEATTPQLLHKAGYESAMFGKFHLAGPENNEADITTPALFGWDYFYGWIGGLPESIDLQAGGVSAGTSNQCGFVPGPAKADGAAFGACHFPDNSCTEMRKDAPEQDVAGLQCLVAGGILAPKRTCADPKPAGLDFSRYNGYYVSPLVILDQGRAEKVLPDDPRSRGYRTTIETDAAIDWINSRPSGKPWMATVSYTSAHTPWQQPPAALMPDLVGPGGYPNASTFDNLSCTSDGSAADVLRMQALQNRMTQALDTEFGRLLVDTGIATWNPDGSLHYDPEASNTLIVIIGDNGSLGLAVKAPFDASRAKGTAYQTGVWVPLIVAGRGVAEPDRDVEHMVNGVDLFELFGELADIDVRQELPASRPVDSVGIRAYLKNPAQPAQRQTNFAISGLNQQANGGRNGPCVVTTTTGSTCMQIATSKAVCGDNSGFWWGEGHDDLTPMGGDNSIASYDTCAQVNEVRYGIDNAAAMYTVMPDQSVAVREERYKLVRNTFKRFEPAQGIHDEVEYEFYEVNQAKGTPLLDEDGKSKINLDGTPKPGWTTGDDLAYKDLKDRLDRLMLSAVVCEGDGNIDGVVDKIDLDNWNRIHSNWGKSSVYDFAGATPGSLPDGYTNGWDQDIVSLQLGKTCVYPPSVY